MYVICINNENSRQNGLTLYKKYKVLNDEYSIKYNGYEIKNDKGNIIFYKLNRFENIRDYNLKQILK